LPRVARPLRAGAQRIAAALALAAFALAVAGGAAAQVLYKWTDVDGKTQYSDRPPKDFKGVITRIEPDEQPAPVTPYQAPRTGVTAGQDGVKQLPDVAAERREVRRRLAAAVERARDRLAVAKAALEDGGAPQDDERQVVQQRVDSSAPLPGPGSASTGGMLGNAGMIGGAPRSNCTKSKGSSGQVVTTCPTLVPNDAYYERIRKLEDDVRAAEEELAAAEQAYRRGAD
jgi:hypothetical protein